jgi:carbonic anhydrase/acetyltransferase-like protein (isoleucine patch superfamily)
MYIVNGDPGATDTGDVVLVYNSDLGYGVMEKADEDGSFSIEIEAEIGDEIIVQIKRGDLTLSSEEGHIIGSTW